MSYTSAVKRYKDIQKGYITLKQG